MANWILICGLLRDELEFRLTLAQIAELRSEGLVDGVILSTWLGEVDAIPALRAELFHTGVDIVESASAPPSTGNTWAQNKATFQGLSVVPEGANVLRMRTDRTAHLFKLFRPLFVSGPPEAVHFGHLQPIFEKKICAQAVAASVPFYAADFAYFGYRDDLMKMVTFDGMFDVQFRGFGAEQRLWAAPFLKAYPELVNYFMHIDILALSNQMVRAVQAGKQIPDGVLSLYAFVWANMWSNIHIAESRDAGDMPLTARAVLGGEPSWGVRIGTIASRYPVRLSTFNTPLALNSVIENALKLKLRRKSEPCFSNALKHIKERGRAALAPYTPDLVDQILEIEDTDQPTVLLRPFVLKRSQVSPSPGANVGEILKAPGFKAALARSFDIELDDQFLEIVKSAMLRVRDGANMGHLYGEIATKLLKKAIKDGTDTTLAGRFFLRGAERGDIAAAGMFAHMAYEGMISNHDPAKLIRWARTAAIKGNNRAIYVMAKLSEENRLPDDLVSDGMYYRKRIEEPDFDISSISISS